MQNLLEKIVEALREAAFYAEGSEYASDNENAKEWRELLAQYDAAKSAPSVDAPKQWTVSSHAKSGSWFVNGPDESGAAIYGPMEEREALARFLAAAANAHSVLAKHGVQS